ncbi:MAG: AIPR family protein [Chloroflexota bacterium]|nr:AIPR family protein [Chloroflexota bacterium]
MNEPLSTHRQNYREVIFDEIIQYSEDHGLSTANAAVRILLDWLEYDEDDLKFIDGRDGGIDVWFSTDDSLEIFQVKTHLPDYLGRFPTHKFDNAGVNDLRRAIELLIHRTKSDVQSSSLKNLLGEWESIKYRHQNIDHDDAVLVGVHLLLLGEGLTENAQAEFDSLRKECESIRRNGSVPIQFDVNLQTISDVIYHRWRQDNRDWRDKNGIRVESIRLYPAVSRAENYISDDQNAVFYCKSIDLVNAYGSLGYQIFEPNVRANIKKSSVNKAIRDSIANRRSRKEFRYLNNGVTIVCNSFKKPRGGRRFFEILRPGVINGLQTVVALHTAFGELEPDAKRDFEENCSVLVRVLQNNAVRDVTSVVRATNNQNSMRPRNLVSNNPEQIEYVRFFAEQLQWFYEAKQGAWDAFSKDPARWRPALNKRKKDFVIPGARSRAKLIDNERLAQTWLAFIGFSYDAMTKKKDLFDDRYYDLIFKKRTVNHGVFYESIGDAKNHATGESPSPSLLLVSQLSWELAKEVTLSPQQNRASAIQRLNLGQTVMSQAELEVKLWNDNEYILNQALNLMPFLFTEFVGYVMYQSLGDRVHDCGSRLIANGSFQFLKDKYQFESVKTQIFDETISADDVLTILWLVFRDLIDDMVHQSWGNSFRAASRKQNFAFTDETRTELYRNFENQNKFMKKREMTRVWAVGISEGKDLCEYVAGLIME